MNKVVILIIVCMLSVSLKSQNILFSKNNGYSYSIELCSEFDINRTTFNLLSNGYSDLTKGDNYIFCRKTKHKKYTGIGWNEISFNISILKIGSKTKVIVSKIIIADSRGKVPLESLRKIWLKRIDPIVKNTIAEIITFNSDYII